MAKPWSSEAVRQGAAPTAQSTSATAPHDRHTTWWWLSPDAPLEPGRAAGRLDAAHQARRGERVQGLVHGLQGDMAQAIAHPRGNGLHAQVIAVPDGLQQRDAGCRHPQARTAQLISGGQRVRRGHDPNLAA